MPEEASPAEGSEANLRPSKLISSDLTQEHYESALVFVNASLDKFTTEKDVATSLKKEFDAKYSGTWQAIVGSCFGCSLTHKTKAVMHFQIEHSNSIIYVLLFQSEE
jgi:dynein light chain LC8-type